MTSESAETHLTLLRRAPEVIRTLTASLPETLMEADEGPESWSVRDVVAHLADLEVSDWLPRARVFHAEGEAELGPVERERFRSSLASKSMDELLDLFAERRAVSLRFLGERGLTTTIPELRATHPHFGSVAFSHFLAAWVVHDLTHIVQVSRVLARHFDQDVGPWRAYLSVLHDRRGG